MTLGNANTITNQVDESALVITSSDKVFGAGESRQIVIHDFNSESNVDKFVEGQLGKCAEEQYEASQEQPRHHHQKNSLIVFNQQSSDQASGVSGQLLEPKNVQQPPLVAA